MLLAELGQVLVHGGRLVEHLLDGGELLGEAVALR
jgi:hypothetical protein